MIVTRASDTSRLQHDYLHWYLSLSFGAPRNCWCRYRALGQQMGRLSIYPMPSKVSMAACARQCFKQTAASPAG